MRIRPTESAHGVKSPLDGEAAMWVNTCAAYTFLDDFDALNNVRVESVPEPSAAALAGLAAAVLAVVRGRAALTTLHPEPWRRRLSRRSLVRDRAKRLLR